MTGPGGFWCRTCGVEFTGQRRLYCSAGCRPDYPRTTPVRMPQVDHLCPTCGSAFRATAKRVYCSQECSRRGGWLRWRYGLTGVEFEAMWLRQSGACAVCRSPFDASSPHVDHDHGTGRVRGLLCFGCNSGIGLLGDDPERVRRALAYLDRAETPEQTRIER